MKRILIIDPSAAVRETVALALARDYELDRRATRLDAVALEDAAAGVGLVISSAGPASWTAELTRLAARKNIAVLLLVKSAALTQPAGSQENPRFLVKPFSSYDLKAAVESMLNRPTPGAAAPAQAASSDYLGFPYVSHAAARLARRFGSLSLPLLIWGERGCGQDQVARAIIGEAHIDAFVALNGVDIGADYLQHQRTRLARLGRGREVPPAILIEGLERLTLPGQSLLLNFIDDFEGTHGRLRLIATANADLLERVYRGDFLERLYQRLAKLTLPLLPLRERRADLPALARCLAAGYRMDLGLGEIDFTPAALARLDDYLWFGNLDELDRVIARTLATHGKAQIDAPDIIFDDSTLVHEAGTHGGEESAPFPAMADARAAEASNGIAGSSPNLRLLVHELAHELKNPMVTIKTFAQLLAERYDDASFRARFQDVVDGDIERMDQLLGVMTEYAGFDQPHRISTALIEHLHSTLEALHDDCAKRRIHVGWKGNGQEVKIMADAAQLRYALKNTLLAVLSKTKAGSEIELAVADSGALAISYVRDGERMQSLSHYFKNGDVPATQNIVPLRILLAREIVERSGGRFDVDEGDGDREIVTMEFPIV
jgi:DNA-binding NtrC family response regulator